MPTSPAAVLRLADVDECVITVDLLTDRVDFILAECDPRRVGRKALAVNLSSLSSGAFTLQSMRTILPLNDTGSLRILQTVVSTTCACRLIENAQSAIGTRRRFKASNGNPWTFRANCTST